MKNLPIKIVLLFLVLSSCKTPQSFTTTITALKDTTIYVDRPFPVDKIIYVPIPGNKDSAKIVDAPVSLPDSTKHIPVRSLYKKQGIISMEITGRWLNINASAYLNDSLIRYRYRDTLRYQDSLNIHNAIRDRTTNTQVVLPPEKYVPKIYMITFWIVIIQILAAVFIILNYFGVFGKLFSLISKR